MAAAHVAVVRYTRKVSEDKQTFIDTQDEAEQAARTEGHAAGRTELIAEQALETPPILLACLQAVARDQENVVNYIRVGRRVVEALNGRNYGAFRLVVRAFREDGVVIQNAGLADFWRRNLEAYQLEVL